MITKEQYGPWAVIPGGSEGIGTSFARQLGRAGINVVLIARKPGPLQETAEQVRAESGVEVRTLETDLTAPDMLETIVAATEGLEVGLLVYNAGAAHGAAPFLEQPLDRSLGLIKLNPVGQVSLAWHFGQGMAKRGRGGIILIGSGAGVVGTGGVAVYAAAKAFTHTFAEGLWAELKPKGVHVMAMPLGRCATPANLRTNITDVGHALTFPADPDEMARQCLANIAKGPIVYPEHLEEVYSNLAAMPRREAVTWMDSFLATVKAGG